MFIFLLGTIASLIFAIVSYGGYKDVKKTLSIQTNNNESKIKKSFDFDNSFIKNTIKDLSFKDEKYIKIKCSYDTDSKFSITGIQELNKILTAIYIFENKFKELRLLNIISELEYKNYISAINETLEQDFQYLKKAYSENRIYGIKANTKNLVGKLVKIEAVINNFKVPSRPIIEKIVKESVQIDSKSVILKSIKDKHKLLNNVISKSLYNNASSLVETQESSSFNPEIQDLIEDQLKQIDNFLQKEIDSVISENDLEYKNKLKANKIYLDSLETHWISENKIN